MSYTRKAPDLPLEREAANRGAVNEVIQTLVDAGIVVHHQQKSADLITTPDASDLATSKTLAAALALAIPAHGADTDIHTTADAIAQAAAWSSAPAEPADLAEVGAIANELKTDINTHVAQTDHHRGQPWGTVGGDGVVVAKAITTANFSSTQGEANALLNAIKAFFNNHVKAAASTIEVIDS